MLEALAWLAIGACFGATAELFRRPWLHGLCIALLTVLAVESLADPSVPNILAAALFVYVAYGYVQEYNEIVSERRERKHGSES